MQQRHSSRHGLLLGLALEPVETASCVAVARDPEFDTSVHLCGPVPLQDMGCGPGRFLLLLCRHHSRQQQQQQPLNYLGLEIRQPVSGSSTHDDGLASSTETLCVTLPATGMYSLGFDGCLTSCNTSQLPCKLVTMFHDRTHIC